MIQITDENGRRIEEVPCPCGHSVAEHMPELLAGVSMTGRCRAHPCTCHEYGSRAGVPQVLVGDVGMGDGYWRPLDDPKPWFRSPS